MRECLHFSSLSQAGNKTRIYKLKVCGFWGFFLKFFFALTAVEFVAWFPGPLVQRCEVRVASLCVTTIVYVSKSSCSFMNIGRGLNLPPASGFDQ